MNNLPDVWRWSGATSERGKMLALQDQKRFLGDDSVYSEYAYHAALNLDVIGRDHYRSHF
jgi:hypothetical protein